MLRRALARLLFNRGPGVRRRKAGFGHPAHAINLRHWLERAENRASIVATGVKYVVNPDGIAAKIFGLAVESTNCLMPVVIPRIFGSDYGLVQF